MSDEFVEQFKKLSIRDVNPEEFKGKRVFLRVDFNLPGIIENEMDDFRIRSTLPTIEALLKMDVKCLVLVSHVSKLKGHPMLSIKPVFELFRKIIKEEDQEISKLVEGEITFIEDWSDERVVLERLEKCEKREIIFLENIRFFKEEKQEWEGNVAPQNVVDFRSKLTKFGDIYVNDAFGCCHRDHSSITGVHSGVEEKKKCAGLLVTKEIKTFQKVLNNPKKPFVVICGGSKLSTKIPMFKNLVNIADEILIGGGMSYTFLKSMNKMSKIGNSRFDKDNFPNIPTYLRLADEKKVEVHLPVDHMVSNDFSKNDVVKVVTNEQGVDEGFLALDIGPQTIENFKAVVRRAKTVLWNGPLGVFENKHFEAGTKELLIELANCTKDDPEFTSVICGGDSAKAAKIFLGEDCVEKKVFSHISTGGGASLCLCEGKVLPGMKVLTKKVVQE